MGADTPGHVRLIQPAQSLVDREQAAVQAVADDALKRWGLHVGRDIDHCADRRGDAKAANRGDVRFRDVVVMHDDLLTADSNSLGRTAVRVDVDVVLRSIASHGRNVIDSRSAALPLSTAAACFGWLYAYMLTGMSGAAALVAQARASAGLSLRELAKLADVSFTTIRRIEAGEMDPTVGMLRRVLSAAGEDLELTTKPASRRRASLAALANNYVEDAGGERPNLTPLRALIDHLALHPEETGAAIAAQPHTQSRLMRALLAGMAEKVADDAGLPRPGWTWTAPKMTPAWEPPGTPRMRTQRRANAPRQLLDRGVIIDESSLWRDRVSVGA